MRGKRVYKKTTPAQYPVELKDIKAIKDFDERQKAYAQSIAHSNRLIEEYGRFATEIKKARDRDKMDMAKVGVAKYTKWAERETPKVKKQLRKGRSKVRGGIV